MTHDLEAALREAREAICRHNLHGAVRIIDAALSAASGEASGDVFVDPDTQEWPTPDDLGPFAGYCCENGNFGDGHTCMKQPAPSEAPNVEPQPRTYWHRFRHYSGGDIWMEQGVYNGQRPIETIPLYDKAALDSARAEGIAAMREYSVKIVAEAEPALFHRVAAAIREAKP